MLGRIEKTIAIFFSSLQNCILLFVIIFISILSYLHWHNKKYSQLFVEAMDSASTSLNNISNSEDFNRAVNDYIRAQNFFPDNSLVKKRLVWIAVYDDLSSVQQRDPFLYAFESAYAIRKHYYIETLIASIRYRSSANFFNLNIIELLQIQINRLESFINQRKHPVGSEAFLTYAKARMNLILYKKFEQSIFQVKAIQDIELACNLAPTNMKYGLWRLRILISAGLTKQAEEEFLRLSKIKNPEDHKMYVKKIRNIILTCKNNIREC